MIAVIDHHDSFTYNLVHIFEQLTPDVRVLQHDRTSPEEVAAMSPTLIVLSPGPGTPEDAQTALQLLSVFSGGIPVLGVCLGHQVIVRHFGGTVRQGVKPVHGKVSHLQHDGSGLFCGIPNPSPVVRYHSLVADEGEFPACLAVTARSEDGAIMAVRHRFQPVEGIQFHPESILTADGARMLGNSWRAAVRWKEGQHGNPVPAF
ncbi:anthranilate synthase component II [Indiicoccus explosivorum]|uniref:anthranilate synthase component II n=1 Tax=Indiicoccus explosivorum TaxID=1917864 RepID=UPI000B43CAC9|nr:aminodeoxychorismate/anthranilate synthase component II [Indiicoccus explosivorum]